MKTYSLLIILISLSYNSFCQLTFNCNNGNAAFQEVFEVPGKTAAELDSIVNRWVAKTWNNPAAATMSRIQNEMIRGKGFESNAVKIVALAYGNMEYTWRIDIKDGKLRFTMETMMVSGYHFEAYVCKNDGTVKTSSQATNVKDSFELRAKLLIESLKNEVLNRDNKKDDW